MSLQVLHSAVALLMHVNATLHTPVRSFVEISRAFRLFVAVYGILRGCAVQMLARVDVVRL
jgi:hypothetical protein